MFLKAGSMILIKYFINPAERSLPVLISLWSSLKPPRPDRRPVSEDADDNLVSESSGDQQKSGQVGRLGGAGFAWALIRFGWPGSGS
jgi:hypothetical protein